MNEDQLPASPQTSEPPPVSDMLSPASVPAQAEETKAPDSRPSEPSAFASQPAEAPTEEPKRKRGRPPGSKSKPQVDPLSVTPNPIPRKPAEVIAAPAPIAADYDALGKVAANLWFNVGTLAFGADWAPDVAQGEPVIVKDAFRDYFQSAGIARIPPDVQLCIVLGGYTLARVQKPTVSSRLGKAWTWIKTKLRREP